MKIVVFAVLLSGALGAQTPPAKSLEPAAAAEPAKADQASTFAASDPKQESNRRFLLPSNRLFFSPTTSPVVEQVLPGSGPCAIPLNNVESAGINVDPKIVIRVSPAAATTDRMPVVQGLPSCTKAGDKVGR